MTKTIKEMAEEYAYTNWQSDDYHDGAAEGLEFDAIGHTEKSYLAGATDILQMVENLLVVNQIHSYHEVYDDIVKLVKELKGK